MVDVPVELGQNALVRMGSTGLTWDEDQELKEAVCDAVLERTRRAVSGEGEFGAVIYGQLPSRALTSGFLLPRLSATDEDESSDISISLHGMDCRLNADEPGVLTAITNFGVYVRVMPTADEVFDAKLGLRPKAELNAAANIHRDAVKKTLTSTPAYKALDAFGKRKALKEAQAKVLSNFNVQEGDIQEAESLDAEQEGDEEFNVIEILNSDVRISDEHTMLNDIPQKYLRLNMELPVLHLPLPWKREAWKNLLESHVTLINAEIKKTYIEWIASPIGKKLAWRNKKVPSSSFWSHDHWNARLAEVQKFLPNANELIPGMQVTMVMDVRPDPLMSGILTARLGIENHKNMHINSDKKIENGIFQVSMQASLPIQALCSMPMERVRRSYQFAGFLLVPAIGVNGGVMHHKQGELSMLTTTWCPRFVLPRMRQTSRAKVPVEFAALLDTNFDVAELDALPTALETWVKEVEGQPMLFEPGEEGSGEDENRQLLRFKGDTCAWLREAERLRLGVKTLTRSQAAYRADPACLSAAPYRAWLLTNETFRRATKNPGWRLFQLGFILTHVPTLASRLPGFEDTFDYEFDEGSASLLYMSTGGGKSEAFFGVLVFALFLDRLRGKRRGVTAMLHYPLRLLTLQQARRLMLLLAQAEMLRHREKLGGAPYELGFWVGSGNTPNSITAGDSLLQEVREIPLASEDPFLRKEAAFQRERPSYKAKNEGWNKIPACPFCGSDTGLRIYREEESRLGIVCSGIGCDWNKAHDTAVSRAALPFLIVDTDIYRRAPAVLLGTVDKLALLGNHPSTINRIAGMFGMARFVAGTDDTGLLLTPAKPDHLAKAAELGRPVAPSFQGGAELFLDPLPSLIVQDEMHLLEESLGTFGGLFETTLFAWFKELAKLLGHRVPSIPGMPGLYRMPHVIGATATAADANRQMQHLYQRRAVQFPHPGPRLYGSFYTELETFDTGGTAIVARGNRVKARDQEAMAPWARVYASLLTNGKTHTSATIEVLSAYAVGVTRWSRDLCAADPARQLRAASEVVSNLSGGELSYRHEAAIQKAVADGRFEILAGLVDLHRIMLTYVTNKKGGDQLMSALDRQVVRDHELMGLDYHISGFDIELISGGVDIRGIQDVIAKAEKPRNPATEDIEGSLRAIVATSAISHGVDVSSFNAMTFSGVPSDIAEYIQASSRVGRTHVGFSLLVPMPRNRRDRFVLDNHETFHRFLEWMIAPPAIERWADKAIQRALPSFIQTYLVGVLFQQEFCAASLDNKRGIMLPDSTIILKERIVGFHASATKAAMLKFLETALGLDAVHGGAPTPMHYRNLLKKAVDDVATELQTGRYGGPLSTLWEVPEGPFGVAKPMNSLRDVDEGGIIHGNTMRNTVKGKRIKASDTREAMDFITKRLIAGRRTGSGSGELAPEEPGIYENLKHGE